MTLIPLSRLLIEGRADNVPVALRGGQPLNFGRFRADGARAAAKFKGCRAAALVCGDGYNFAVGFFGLLHAGAKIMFPPNNRAGSLQGLKEEFDLAVDDALIENGHPESASLLPLDAAQSSLAFFTSGSTGTPRKILKNLRMLEREIEVLDRLWGKDSGLGPVFSTVSHRHIYGLTFKLLWPLMAGRPFMAGMHALWESLLAELTDDAVLVSSPAHLDRMDGLAPLPREKSIKRIFSAGAPLPPEASRQAEIILGCRPTEIFGSTETGAFATRRQDKNDEPWRLLPGISMRVDRDGRLVLCTPFMGEGWLATEDRVEISGDGFRFLGRADRIVKIEGKRVSLAEVEHALAQLPLVQSAASVMLPGEPEQLAAAIVPGGEGWKILEKTGSFRFGRLLRKELASARDASGIPRRWRFVRELPVHAMGKRRDADIRALFAEDNLMNLPPLLAVNSSKNSEVTLAIEISAGLEAFRGHFPGQPVLPGVVQIDWVVRFAALYFDMKEFAARDFQVKFRNVIGPGKPLSLVLHCDRSRNRLAFTYMSGEAVMSSGHMKLGA